MQSTFYVVTVVVSVNWDWLDDACNKSEKYYKTNFTSVISLTICNKTQN